MLQPLRVLLIEDSEDDALLLLRQLQKDGFAPKHCRVDTLAELSSALEQFKWDIVLCDVTVPHLSAPTVLKTVRAYEGDIPFIVVSGIVPEEKMTELMCAGAGDVIVKDRLSRLGPAVRRAVEEAAVRKERCRIEGLLEAAIQSISEGFALYDTGDRLVTCNERYREIHNVVSDLIRPGVEFEEVVREGVRRGEYPAAEGCAEAWIAGRLEARQGGFVSREEPFNGGRWIVVNERPVPEGGTAVILTDITERKRAETALQERESHLRLITDNIPAFIAYVDSKGRYRIVNRTGELWYGRRQNEILGSSANEILGDKVSAILRPHFELALAGAPERFETEISYPNGIRRDVECVYVPDRDPDGTVRGVFAMAIDMTERKRAERALRESNVRFRNAFITAPHGMALVGTDGRWLRVNRALCDILGYDEAELLQTDSQSLTFPEDLDREQQYVRQILAGEMPIYLQMEKRYRRKDGAVVEVLQSASLVRDASGNPQHFVLQIVDITERNRAEQLVREREAFISTILECMSDGLVTIDEGGNILSVNESALQSFGYEREELEGRNVKILMPEPHKGKHDEYLAEYLATGRSKILGVGPRALKGRRKDGTDFPMELAISEMEGDKGPIFIGAIRDITERKKVERAMRESEERFRSAFETAPHGMALVSLNGEWLRVNRAIAELFGYDMAEINFFSMEDVTHPEDWSKIRAAMRRFRTGELVNYQMESRHFSKDGARITALFSASLVQDDDGMSLYCVVQIIDLTAMKKAQEKFQQSQKMEVLGQLTGGLAHDFNNLLTVILGNARLLERGLDGDEKMKAKAGAISKTARRGASLVARLSALSRKQDSDTERVDVSELLRGARDLLSRTIGAEIEIEMHVGGDALFASADPGQFENAILNLAINARDAMPDGGKLAIEAAEMTGSSDTEVATGGSQAKEFVVVTVSDTGTGIARDALDRIFEPFFTTKEKGKGTGLGLSMVSEFVEQSGGYIEVNSEEGVGTTFQMFLPNSDSADQSNKIAPSPDDIALGGGETVLVVEDESELREFAASYLRQIGYRVVEADSGAAALRELEGNPDTQVLFTDVVMPGGMNGRELAEAATARRPELKILFTSGYSSDVMSADFPREKGWILLRKPYEGEDLARTLRNVIAGPRDHRMSIEDIGSRVRRQRH